MKKGPNVETTAKVRRGSVIAGGARSPYIESGPAGAGEAIVLIHGNPGSSRDWETLVEKAGTFGRAIAPDMPGFGKADKPDNFDYTVEGYARHLDEMLRELGVERAHLVLHDFGGPWGLAWAAHNPEKFASVTLINIGVMPGYRWHYLARVWRTPLVGEVFMATTTRPGFRLLLKHGNPRGLPREFVDRMYEDFDRRTRRAVLKLYRATEDPGAAGPLTAALRPLDRPALVLWGAHDPYVPVRYAERQREVFPRARVVVLEDGGHWPFADNAEAVGAEVIPFLRRQFAGSGAAGKAQTASKKESP